VVEPSSAQPFDAISSPIVAGLTNTNVEPSTKLHSSSLPLSQNRPRPLHLLLPTIDTDVGAADFRTAYSRLRSLEYLFY
jgi:hypothetical protein